MDTINRKQISLFTLALALLSFAPAQAAPLTPEEQRECDNLKRVDSNLLAWKHFVAIRCDLALAPHDGQIFAAYYNAIDTKNWGRFPSNLSRAEFVEIQETQNLARLHIKRFKFPSLHTALEAFIETAGRFDSNAFLAMLIRIFPCTDGGLSEIMASSITTWMVQAPDVTLSLAADEQKAFADDRSLDSCTKELKEATLENGKAVTLIHQLATALDFSWQSEGAPVALRKKLNAKFKTTFSPKVFGPIYDVCETMEVEQPKKGRR
jgi:hypothetical protein